MRVSKSRLILEVPPDERSASDCAFVLQCLAGWTLSSDKKDNWKLTYVVLKWDYSNESGQNLGKPLLLHSTLGETTDTSARM